MDLDLRGKFALVTGGSHGIGRVIAIALAKEGCNVAICSRDKKKLLETKNEILKHGVMALALTCNVLIKEDVKKVMSSITFSWNALHILINNVGGVEKFGNFFDLTDDDWINSFNLNLMSVVRFSRDSIPLLKKSNFSKIINISSLVAHQPGRFNPHYGVAKVGMLYLNKYLANELAEYNILVNAICPGTIKGGSWKKNVNDRARRTGLSIDETEKIMENEEKLKVPLLRMGIPEDIAELTIFLASNKANFINGVVFDVDGGVSRSIF